MLGGVGSNGVGAERKANIINMLLRLQVSHTAPVIGFLKNIAGGGRRRNDLLCGLFSTGR